MAVQKNNAGSTTKELLATVTRRGQVTIPAQVRRLLGIRTGDKLAFQIDDGKVRLAAPGITLESAYRSVKPIGRPEDFKRIEVEAKEAHVALQVRKLRHS